MQLWLMPPPCLNNIFKKPLAIDIYSFIKFHYGYMYLWLAIASYIAIVTNQSIVASNKELLLHLQNNMVQYNFCFSL